MQKLLKVLVIGLLILLWSQDLQAQCAMCKAVAESSQEGGSSVADGLNSGIVYLMFFPYLLMGAVGFAIYRHKKSKA